MLYLSFKFVRKFKFCVSPLVKRYPDVLSKKRVSNLEKKRYSNPYSICKSVIYFLFILVIEYVYTKPNKYNNSKSTFYPWEKNQLI